MAERMKAILRIGVALLAVALVASNGYAGGPCCKLPTASTAAGEKTAPAPNVTLQISGMTCGGCAPRVQKALTTVKGVKSAEVSYERAEAVVVFDSPKRMAKDLIKAVKKAGFHARVKPEETASGSRSSSS